MKGDPLPLVNMVEGWTAAEVRFGIRTGTKCSTWRKCVRSASGDIGGRGNCGNSGLFGTYGTAVNLGNWDVKLGNS